MICLIFNPLIMNFIQYVVDTVENEHSNAKAQGREVAFLLTFIYLRKARQNMPCCFSVLKF